MPVKPPAASARKSTAGNQNLLKRFPRCSVDVLTIVLDEYDFKFEREDFLSIRCGPLNNKRCFILSETTMWVATVIVRWRRARLEL
jgi:hypothetical protein